MEELTSLGKYEIRRELGRGAMGVVYEGYDPMIKRTVALKTIRADQLQGENAQSAIARFRREAQAAGRLQHPNIIAIYDFGEDAGISYIAMEYVQGRELKDYFHANERFTTADIVRIMTQILDALGYSHKLGVIHRDIKPANVILLPAGAVKVADFGIAHIESSNMTQVGTVLGTPSYMSPEQIMGLPIDGRSDLFSAAVILYQFLTGERPFSGSATATMHKVLEEDPLPPSRFNVQIPGAMDAVVRKALAKRPDERYQTAEEFAAALAAAAKHEVTASSLEATVVVPAAAQAAPRAAAGPTGTVIATPAAATPTLDPAPVAAAATSAPSAPPAKRSQMPAIVVVAALAVIGGGAALWTLLNRPAAEAPKVAQAPLATPAGGATVAASAPAAAPAPSAQPANAALASTAPPPAAPAVDAGKLVVSAVGLVDPGAPRYNGDKALAQSDLRADSKSQAVEKALGLLLDTGSLAKNYDILNDRLLSKSGNYITTVIREGEPHMGKDGLMSMTTDAVVDVRSLQKSLNQMSRNERVELIRAGGDPRISVRVDVRDADAPNAPPQPSPVAENLLKERIKSFGFRTWVDDGARSDESQKSADFVVLGEAQVKKLSMKLAASGVVVTKYTLAAWTVKCIDRATGEEIYFNTALPKGVGSWASEGEALKAIGTGIADEFSRDFFLQHVPASGRRVSLTISGISDPAVESALEREFVGLPAVITLTPRTSASPRVYDVVLAGSGADGDIVSAGVLKPLNAKFGQACFGLGAVAGAQVTVSFDARCADNAVLSRLETNPPAGLYGAPPARQRALIRDPEKLKRLSI